LLACHLRQSHLGVDLQTDVNVTLGGPLSTTTAPLLDTTIEIGLTRITDLARLQRASAAELASEEPGALAHLFIRARDATRVTNLVLTDADAPHVYSFFDATGTTRT